MNTFKVALLALLALCVELGIRFASLFEGFLVLIPLKYLIPALIGGLVDYISEARENVTKKSLKEAFIRSIVSGFSGMLTYLICMDFGISEYKMAFLIGISGFAGVRAIKFFENVTKAMVKKAMKLRFVEEEIKHDNESNKKVAESSSVSDSSRQP